MDILRDHVNVEFKPENYFYQAVKELSIKTISVPIMDGDLKEFVDHYHSEDNWVILDEKGFPLAAFIYRANATEASQIFKRDCRRLFVHESLR